MRDGLSNARDSLNIGRRSLRNSITLEDNPSIKVAVSNPQPDALEQYENDLDITFANNDSTPRTPTKAIGTAAAFYRRSSKKSSPLLRQEPTCHPGLTPAQYHQCMSLVTNYDERAGQRLKLAATQGRIDLKKASELLTQDLMVLSDAS